MSFTIHASRDPELIPRAVAPRWCDSSMRYLVHFEFQEFYCKQIENGTVDADVAFFTAFIGIKPLFAMRRDDQELATSGRGFFELRDQQLEAHLAAVKTQLGSRNSAAIHLEPPDGRFFTAQALLFNSCALVSDVWEVAEAFERGGRS
jgi:hypothetical protein